MVDSPMMGVSHLRKNYSMAMVMTHNIRLRMNLPSIYGQKMKVFQMMNGLALSSY
jgi:hypothetical protein